jgi:hypothetical protein
MEFGGSGGSGGPGSSLTVTDGVTPVINVTTLDFLSGAVVTSGGAGTANVAISGSGGGTPVAPSTGNVDGVNAAFGAPSDPKYAVADGATYFEGAGYSYAGGIVTFTVAPSEYVRLFL